MNEHPTSDNALLEAWLETATLKLSTESIAQVRVEIQEHYELALEEASTPETRSVEAHRAALESLGDANAVNRSYRKVLITAKEAKLLRKIELSTPPISKRTILELGIAFAVVTCASILLPSGGWFYACAVMVLASRAYLFLPDPTPATGRVWRCAIWSAIASVLLTPPFRPALVEYAVVFAVSLIVFVVPVEWRCARLRKKLPVERWPRGLFI